MTIPKNKRNDNIDISTDELTFRGQRPDERLIFLLHQHPWVLFRRGLMIVTLLLVLGLVFVVFGPGPLLSLAIFGIVPIALYLFVTAWYTWSNTVFVLTDHRIIAVYQRGWLARNVSETELENIVSIEHAIEGFSKSLFNYGILNIHSSGAAETEILLENIYDPYGVQQKILDFAKNANQD
jgi:hypothetical protein